VSEEECEVSPKRLNGFEILSCEVSPKRLNGFEILSVGVV